MFTISKGEVMGLMKRVLFKNQPMQNVNVRLPVGIRDKARAMADANSAADGTRYFESDVYRTAILSFFGVDFTDSKASEGGDS
jgi:hypothetical protein